MFKMIEVIGSSPDSYSEAVKNAVQQLMKSGEKVHFFEVIEQRGAVRDNAFKEFQVKLKVAVEIAAPQAKAAEPPAQNYCPTCEQPAGETGHLCVPTHKKDERCQWCGALIADERHLCDDKVKKLAYICNSCGRTAVKAEYLCHPQKIAKEQAKKKQL